MNNPQIGDLVLTHMPGDEASPVIGIITQIDDCDGRYAKQYCVLWAGLYAGAEAWYNEQSIDYFVKWLELEKAK